MVEETTNNKKTQTNTKLNLQPMKYKSSNTKYSNIKWAKV